MTTLQDGRASYQHLSGRAPAAPSPPRGPSAPPLLGRTATVVPTPGISNGAGQSENQAGPRPSPPPLLPGSTPDVTAVPRTRPGAAPPLPQSRLDDVTSAKHGEPPLPPPMPSLPSRPTPSDVTMKNSAPLPLPPRRAAPPLAVEPPLRPAPTRP